MKVSNTEIQDLYCFTRKHFVEHYDLQTELVDHLANDIEMMWEENPHLSFEEAKNRAFKKFGVFGFMDAISSSQKAMSKRYRAYLWQELKQWFQIPQFAITLLIFIGFIVVFKLPYPVYLLMGIYLCLSAWVTVKTMMLKRKFENRVKLTKKKWLLEDMIFNQSGAIALLSVVHIFNLRELVGYFLDNSFGVLVMALCFTLLVLLSYISIVVLPKKAEKLLTDTYPEFKIV